MAIQRLRSLNVSSTSGLDMIIDNSSSIEFITSATFSGASSVIIDRCFSSKYNHYLIMRSMSGTFGYGINAAFRSFGSSITSSSYSREQLGAYSTTPYAARANSESLAFVLLGYTDTTACGVSWTIVSNPYANTYTTYHCFQTYDVTSAATNLHVQSQMGALINGSVCDGIEVSAGAGTITGTIWVYGFKEIP